MRMMAMITVSILLPLGVALAPPGEPAALYPGGSLGVMLDVIREQETQAVKPWVWQNGRWQVEQCAIGRASEFGPWQVRLTTMNAQLGDRRPDWEIVADLCDPTVAPGLAVKVLRDCWRRGWRSDRKMLVCWNGGPRNTSAQAREYADDVHQEYAERIKEGKPNGH